MNYKMRKSNFELLRIVSMFLILMSHADDIFGLAYLYNTTLGVMRIITDLFDWGGQVGVGCFVMLSGYFMVERKGCSPRKILKVYGEVYFYSFGIFLLWLCKNSIYGTLEIKQVVTEIVFAVFPILSVHYWFATVYIILLIMAPWLNRFVNGLCEREYKELMIILCIINIFLYGGVPGSFKGIFGGRLLPVIFYYLWGGYIRKSNLKANNKKSICTVCACVIVLISTFSLITMFAIRFNSSVIMEYRYYYRELTSPLVFMIYTQIFLLFKDCNVSNSYIINTMAKCTFGVYLIHQNRIVSRNLNKALMIYQFANPLKVLITSLMTVMLLYLLFSFIDFLRNIIDQKVLSVIFDKIMAYVKKKDLGIMQMIYKLYK